MQEPKIKVQRLYNHMVKLWEWNKLSMISFLLMMVELNNVLTGGGLKLGK